MYNFQYQSNPQVFNIPLDNDKSFYYNNQAVKHESYGQMLSSSRYETADTDPINFVDNISKSEQNEHVDWNNQIKYSNLYYQQNPYYYPFQHQDTYNEHPIYTHQAPQLQNQYPYEVSCMMNTFQPVPEIKAQEIESQVKICPRMKSHSFWDEEDNIKLLNLAKKFKNNWERISNEFSPRIVPIAFLKKKFSRLVNEQVHYPRRVKFSDAEDLIIVKEHLNYDTNWDLISSKLINRTAEMVKNRFYNHIKRKNLYDELLQRVLAGEEGHLTREASDEEDFTESDDISFSHVPSEMKISPKNEGNNSFTKSQEQILLLMKKAHNEIKNNELEPTKQDLISYVVMLERTLNENLSMMKTLKEKLDMK